MKQIRAIRLIWVGALAGVVVFLLWKAIVPLGSITYSTDLGEYDYFISELSPKDRLEVSAHNIYNQIKAEPVYFYLHTPRPFQTAKVTLNFENAPPLMELGICRDKKNWNFQRLPVYFKKLEELALSDQTILENGVLLWQKEKVYSSVDDLKQNPPTLEKISVYNYDYSPSVFLPSYQSSPVARDFKLGARGNYILSTYSNGEPLDMTFTINQKDTTAAASTISVTVYDQQNEIIKSLEGKSTDSQIILTTEALAVGAYRLEFKADNNIETDTVRTFQTKLSFINYVWLTNLSRSNFSIFTDATNVSVQTINPEKLQTLQVHSQALEIRETYNQFSLPLEDHTRKIKEIRFEKDDVMLAGDGFFALSSEDIFESSPRQFSNKIDLATSDIEYIIAGYEPIGLNSTGERTVNFDLYQACLDKGRYPFIISTPQVNEHKPVKISKITVTVIGKNLLEFIKSIWERI
jgi:5-hydroxyisourate hydrolase-like protein (transthyretin family)